jgi:hypothetical protein
VRRQVAMETNLCRKGLFWQTGKPVALELPLDGEDLLGLITTSGRLKVSPDLEILAWLTERWRQERSPDHWVHFTLYELGQSLYGHKPSGADVRSMRGALARLKSITVTLMGYDSRQKKMRANVASLDNLIDRIVTELDDLGPKTSPDKLGGLRGSTFQVQLPFWLVDQLEAGSITYLDFATMRKLTGLAKRLWVLLAAERYKRIGRGSEGTWIKLGEKAFTSLGMNYHYERQARAAIKRAGTAIVAADPRFESVTVEARPGGHAIIAVRTGRDMEQGKVRRQIHESLCA